MRAKNMLPPPEKWLEEQNLTFKTQEVQSSTVQSNSTAKSKTFMAGMQACAGESL